MPLKEKVLRLLLLINISSLKFQGDDNMAESFPIFKDICLILALKKVKGI